jgi:histone acetyltransferase (RNA polymerase elongator complex component)
MSLKHYTIPIFVPELACPFRCVFCNQEKITSRGHIPGPVEVHNIIEQYHCSFPKGKKHVEIGFFGGNFTGIPLEDQEKYLQIAHSYLERGMIQGIRLSTRPDYIDEQGLRPLKKYGVTTIELGAQSMDDEVLIQSARGHTAEDVEVASRLILAHGFRLGLQMMIGLPGDSLEKAVLTAKKIIELGAVETRIYPVLVISGTKMAEWYEEGKYQPLTMEATIAWLKELLPLFEDAAVEVTRVGLHSSEGLLSGKELVAGPFHPSIRELAMTEVWWDRLKSIGQSAEGGALAISVNPSQYNFAIGYYGKNRKRLFEKIKNVSFEKDKNLKTSEYRVDYR